MIRRHFVALSFACVVLATTVGYAQPATGIATSSESEVNARRLFTAGEAAFAAERYEAALSYFEQAYALVQLPALLYNVGVAAERAGDEDRAIEAFERFLEESASAPNRLEVEGRLRVLRRERAERTSREASTADASADASESLGLAPASEPTASGGASSALGWSVVGGSAAIAVAGGVLLGLGARDYATVENAPDGTSWSSIRDANARAPRLSNAGIACGVVGVVGATVGVVLVVTREDDHETDVAFTGTGMILRRTF